MTSPTFARTMHQCFIDGLILLGGILMACAGCQVRGSVRVGGACSIDQTCLSGVCLPESQSQDGRAWIGGYCSGNCSSTLKCPQGTCLKMDDGRSYCVSECSSSKDCRQDYVCSPDAKVCLPDCRLGWSCGSVLVCNKDNGACTVPNVTPQPLGSPCALNAGCQGNLCIPESSSDGNTSWTGGTCTEDCAFSACPSGSTCLTFQDGNARCLTACSASNSCRQGYVCSPDAKVCLPDCRLGWSCGSSLTCDKDTGGCTAPQPTPQSLGSPCTLNAGCQGDLCIPESSSNGGTSWTAGTCTQDCAASDCPSGSTCLAFQDGSSRCLTTCSDSKTCREGYVCSPDAKVCLPDCRLGWPCGSSLTCDSNSGACTAPEPTRQSLGSPCTLNAGCQGNLCIPESSSSSGTTWTAGTCTQDCAASACPSGSACFAFEDGNSRCLATCSASNDCRQGYVCSPDVKVCLPDCRLGWSCGSTLICDSATGACTAPQPTPLPVGSPCTLNAGCESGLCIPQTGKSSNSSWSAGTCTQDCAASACPSGSTCLMLQDGNSRCLLDCSDSNTCRQGYVCSPDAKVCLPDCRLGWSCGSSLTCDSATGACTAPQPTPQPLGSPCTLNAGCQSGLCIPQTSSASGTVWTAGTCAQDCAHSACPSGSACFTFMDGNSRCLTACSGPTCRQGYVCSSDVRVCLPDCRLGWSCANLICDQNTGECETALVPDGGVRLDAARDTALFRTDAFSPGTGGSGGGGPGPGGQGGRGGPMW